ncbi:cytochrome P450 [Actinomadura rubrisoli]|uniref:Cytochrome P450 n=1 Tax=Actinomadura rubrisoli TaxID=2530368 RepID=A0A4R4ZZB4_9ACTN|nr:cytochrome P450 [Actinomadura rubrisoli]TDD63746.1 cytochrome P450 [Actinomadura rubrisoli]
MTVDEGRDLTPITELRTVGPVTRVMMLSGEAGYAATRFHDAQRILPDPAFSCAHTAGPGARKHLPRKHVGSGRTLFNLDPPEHTRLRRMVSKAFTRGRVEAMGEEIQAVVDGLLDRMAATGPPVDLVEALCAPLPIAEICGLLGVPYEDREAFHGWADAIMSVGGPPQEEVLQARRALQGDLVALVAAKREEPADDLLSALLAAGGDEEEPITEAEVVTLGVTLLVAGTRRR